jgi:hypothetical protein
MTSAGFPTSTCANVRGRQPLKHGLPTRTMDGATRIHRNNVPSQTFVALQTARASALSMLVHEAPTLYYGLRLDLAAS